MNQTPTSSSKQQHDSLFKYHEQNLIYQLIHQFENYGYNIELDTVHILIQNAFKNGQNQF